VGLEETPGWFGLFFVGELDDEGYGEDGNAYGDDALDDEYP
jgi:hypothetical protein